MRSWIHRRGVDGSVRVRMIQPDMEEPPTNQGPSPAATVVSDVAMSPEVAGIIGAVGGALAAVLGTIYTARRKEQRDARAASRLLLAELEEARNAIAFALDENDWETLASRPPDLPSGARVSQTVAAHARPKTWRSLADAQRAVELMGDVSRSQQGSRRIYLDADPDAPGDSDRTELTQAKQEIEEAILALARTSRSHYEAAGVRLDRELAEKYP